MRGVGAIVVALGGASGCGHFLVRGPAGEAFIYQLDFEAKLFAQAGGEFCGFFGHFAGGAVEIEWIAYDDVARGVVARDFAQLAEDVGTVFAFEDAGGTRGDAQLVGDGQADAAAAVVEAEDTAGKSGDCARGSWLRRVRLLRGLGVQCGGHHDNYRASAVIGKRRRYRFRADE